MIREAEQKQIGYKEFLINLLKAEDEGKSRRKRERLLDHAGFEYIKTLDQIDYSFNSSLLWIRTRSGNPVRSAFSTLAKMS